MKTVEEFSGILYDDSVEGCDRVNEHEFSFQSFQDGLMIKGTLLIPDQPIGILQIVHGMSEHRQRYFPFMRQMAEAGWICAIHDHRGHGESVKSSDDYGYFYDRSGTYMVEDTHQLTYLMKGDYPDLPYVLFGHSMGSLVVRAYAKKYDYELDGLIVCGSPSKNRMAFAGQLLASMLTWIKGDHYRSPLLQKLAFGSYIRGFADERSENAWLCSDRSVVAAYDKDPACGFTFTLNGFLSLFRLMRYTYDPEDWKLLNKEMPIFFIAGEDDPCILDVEKFKEAYKFMAFLGYQHVSDKLYHGMRHELLNERKKDVVIEDIAQFLKTCADEQKQSEKEPVQG